MGFNMDNVCNLGNLVNNSQLTDSHVGDINNTLNIYVQNQPQGFTRQEQHDIDVYRRVVAEIPKDVPGYFCLMCDTLMYRYNDSRFIPHTVYALDDPKNHFINPELQKMALKLRNSFNDLYGFMAINFFEDDNKNFWMGEGAKSDYKIYHIQFNEILDKAEAAYKAFVYKATELFGI